MDDYLPLSMLNQLEYCERRFFLMHVRGEMEVNAQHMTGKKIRRHFYLRIEGHTGKMGALT
jgi:CRISPR/Cas system-associated exonuclease Cas4 (RecB family)